MKQVESIVKYEVDNMSIELLKVTYDRYRFWVVVDNNSKVAVSFNEFSDALDKLIERARSQS